MSKKVSLKPESSGTNISDNNEDLITGISVSQENTVERNSGSSMEDTAPHNSSRKDRHSQPFFFNDDIIGQKYIESARFPGIRHVHGTKIVWKKTQNVLELPVLGHFRTYEKRVERSRPNPWRRHGALVKIHEIGGWISKMEKQQISRRNRKYFYVKAGSKPCNPPSRPPISIRESKFLPPSSISFLSTTNRSVEELSYVAAIYIQEAIQNSLSVLLKSQNNEEKGHDKVNEDNEDGYTTAKLNSSGRSSSARRLAVRPMFPSGTSSRSRSLSLLGRKRR
uniref:Uncharacterized protein n=1 Tax=Setaria digitata TaxID=48799 RepID=A0A915PUM8_9BILA